MEWLRRRVWPMEAAHTPPRCARRPAWRRPSCCSSGTTTVLTMETVHDTDVVFESGRRERPARDDRQVHDGLRRARCRRGCRRRRSRSHRRERRAPQALARRRRRAAARRVRAALRGVVLARAARGGRGLSDAAQRARPHARVRVARRDRDRPADVGRPDEHRVPRRPSASRRRGCAPRTASGWTTPSSSCWPSTTSR